MSETKTRVLEITLPISAEAIGRWLEQNGATIHVACMLGTYHVTVTKRKLFSYSDEDGKHAEEWEYTSYEKNLSTGLLAALRKAGAL